jgi:hypothetical protein
LAFFKGLKILKNQFKLLITGQRYRFLPSTFPVCVLLEDFVNLCCISRASCTCHKRPPPNFDPRQINANRIAPTTLHGTMSCSCIFHFLTCGWMHMNGEITNRYIRQILIFSRYYDYGCCIVMASGGG